MVTKYVLFRREARHGKVVKSLNPLPNKVNVNMQHFPLFGSGYLAGEFPSGTTTVEGAPVAAEVRALWRGPAGHPADGAVCGSAQSGISGTWIITNLNESLRYDVVGRKDGFNDVIVAGVTPTSMVEITYSGAVVENETFTGAVGFLELVGGIPPYSVAAETPFPVGLFPVMDGRNLIIDGTTDADEVASFDVKVTSSNGAEKIIPLQLVVGFKAPANFKAETVAVDDVFSVSLTWEVTNSTQQIRVFRSATPFDMDDLPEPIATLSGTSTTYTDDDVIEDDRFYYMVTAVCEQYELRSNVIAEKVIDGDPHWDSVVSILQFDEGLLVDGKGVEWGRQGNESAYVNYEVTKWGDGAYHSTGNGSITTTSDVIKNFGSDAWTWDGWVNIPSGYPERFAPLFAFGSQNSSGGRVITVYMYDFTADYCTFELYGGMGYSGFRLNDFRFDTWLFIEVSETSSASGDRIRRVFCNGILAHEIIMRRASASMTRYTLGSAYVQAQRYSKAYIDEARLTRGVVRNTVSYVPPTKPFPNK